MSRESCFNSFVQSVRQAGMGRMLHLGTARSRPGVSTLEPMKEYFPTAIEHIGTDLHRGPDVDIACDLHEITAAVPPDSFDFICSCSTFEHLRRPWVVAEQLARIIKPGGLIFVQTHQSFPLHAYPFDFYRFTTHSLSDLFGPDFGWKTIVADYDFPAQIIPPPEVECWNDRAPAFLNVNCLARRAG